MPLLDQLAFCCFNKTLTSNYLTVCMSYFNLQLQSVIESRRGRCSRGTGGGIQRPQGNLKGWRLLVHYPCCLVSFFSYITQASLPRSHSPRRAGQSSINYQVRKYLMGMLTKPIWRRLVIKWSPATQVTLVSTEWSMTAQHTCFHLPPHLSKENAGLFIFP